MNAHGLRPKPNCVCTCLAEGREALPGSGVGRGAGAPERRGGRRREWEQEEELWASRPDLPPSDLRLHTQEEVGLLFDNRATR